MRDPSLQQPDSDDRERREFAEVIGWEDEQQKSRRKNTAGLPWFKFYVQRAETPTWLNMSASQRGDFVQCLIVASKTGNTIPIDARFLRRHQLNRKKLNFLSQLGLIRISSAPLDDNRFNDMRSNLVNRMSNKKERERKKKKQEEDNHPRDSTSEEFDAQKVSDTSQGHSASQSDRRVNGMKLTNRGHDSRGFDTIKQSVLDVARRLGTDDPTKIHNCAGQSLRITLPQAKECVRQLRKDGEL